MTERARLSDVFEFNNFSKFFKGCSIAAWENIPETTRDEMSMLYYFNNSSRYISPALESFLRNFNVGQQQQLTLIGDIFTNMYGNSLSSLYRALFSEYNPIENYMMIEKGDDTRELTDDTTDTHNKHNTNTTTTDGELTIANNSTRDIKKAGFNNANPVLDTVETANENDTNINNETVEQSEDETHTGQSVKTVTESNKHNFTRSGNIGVTTSQQMIESEIELRKKEYWDIVFKKLNDLLTLSIY